MTLTRRRLLARAAPVAAVSAALPLVGAGPAFAATGTGSITLVTPFRLQDSRTMEPDKYGTSARDSLADGRLAGYAGALLNVTVTDTEGTGFFRLGAAFVDPPPTSNINWWGPGQTLANLAAIQVTSLGGFVVQGGGSGRAHLIIDVVGLIGA